VIGSLIADMTLTLVTQFLFTVTGLVLLLLRVDNTAPIWRVLLGLLIFLPMVGGLFALQRYGLVRMGGQLVSKLFGPRWSEQIGSAMSLDRMVRLIYRRPSRVVIAVGGQLAGWLLGTGEIWLALSYLGSPVSLGDALVIESLTQALSAVAFLIPGAIGVQEGGFVLFCTLLGLPADIGMALALARRFRDLLIFVPGLVALQIGEAGNLVFGKPAAQRRRRPKRPLADRRPTDTEHPRHDRALLLAHAQRPQDHHLP
jgi:putative membrane protein